MHGNSIPSAAEKRILNALIINGVYGWMDELDFNLFNSIPVMSGRWEVDNERLCAMADKISPRAGIELGPQDQ